MRFLMNLLEEFDAALDWQDDDLLLADRQTPAAPTEWSAHPAPAR